MLLGTTCQLDCLVLITYVEGDDTATEVVILIVLEPSDGHQVEHFLLIGMHANRFGQILVAVLITRDQFANRRQDLERVQVVGGLKCTGRLITA